MSRVGLWLAAALVCALVVVPGAAAHAVLVETNPANDAVLGRSPSRILLRFNEPVETAFGSIRVYDGDGDRVDRGTVERPDAESVAIPVARPLPRGTYTVSWRVVSADSHPVHGAFVFSVGARSGSSARVAAEVLRDEQVPASVSVGFTAVRAVAFALLLLTIGGAAALAFALRGSRAAVRTAPWLAVVAGLLVPAALVQLLFQGASAGGFGLGRAASRDVLSEVAGTQFGQVQIATAALAALVAVAAVALRRAGSWLDVLVGPAGALAVMPALGGHAWVEGPVATTVDSAHVAAAAIWTGGLAFVALALLRSPREERWPVAARVVPRFSAVAVGAVAVLLAAGIVNGYLEVRDWRGLWETTYGRLLLAKVALIVPLLGIGAYNNRFAVPRLRAELASRIERRRFLRATGAELAVVCAIVGVTAVLVHEPPARNAVAPTGPYATESQVGPFDLNLIVDPARQGSNQVHLYLLDRSGQPAHVADARLSASLPASGIGPLPLRSSVAGPGHWIVLSAPFAIAGDWRLRVEVRRGRFDEWQQDLTIPIRKD